MSDEQPHPHVKATHDIGPQLLGRNRPTKERRLGDIPMAPFLGTEDPLVAALAVLRKSHSSVATKVWASIATERILGMTPVEPVEPVPPVPDTPQPGDVHTRQWPVKVVLDQGQTGHCTAFSGGGWRVCEPVASTVSNQECHDLYYEEKVIDGEPSQENGSTIHTLAKVMVKHGWMSAYVWASSIDDIAAWVLKYGPVVMGTDWYSGMFSPDKDGMVKLSGQVEGGHAWYIHGADTPTRIFSCTNNWGTEWGLGGHFKVSYDDMAQLLQDQGEAMAAVQIMA